MKALNQISSVNSDTSEPRQETMDIVKLAERLAFGLSVRHVTQVYQGAAKAPKIKYMVINPQGLEDDNEYDSRTDALNELLNCEVGDAYKEALRADGHIANMDEIDWDLVKEVAEENGYRIMEVYR